ncbi:16S rRNA (cytosine(1402)-N(4))-methyltransferase RsmH [Yimella sp. cx-51]|uniref:16S rRNA (cytosine(1402)-N(4))-methyltransferase RsmH n=1 Tax=Yimella sp. cx-51 TaxID=2770551 RepID=UPI00165E71DB|nr:16S rRNA (cytosine(1402)-N(4))-methyltransferase RsmH [Yimella sp. cx-51]MBC9957265.1 16S rRNA (cytosine(1402)-N(4))-methyltransferase RsmH [Yimella sp. cx-51]QTH37096.1 16S rRNA (cytosine(1402)-N(4))-methyltransferase RsmH [Yimella sp. cx-51]
MSEDRTVAQRHVPVMRDRIVELLAPALGAQGAVYLDGTLGMGGHTEAILQTFPNVRAFGVDRDTDALRLAGERLAPFGDRFVPVHARYDDAIDELAALGVTSIDAALFDLGVSSLQLDETDRGFSYSQHSDLDMRMDQTSGMTAADVLAEYSESQLRRIIGEYGEERFAGRVAKAIVRRREQSPIRTSDDLMEILRAAIPAASQRTGGHPGKRTFQALRIEVNQELASWQAALPAAVDALAVGGRIAVLSYHSLEDRITKRALQAGARSTAPAGLPVELPEHQPYLSLLTRGAEVPDDAEIQTNPRAASARLRVAERTRSTKGSTR